MKLILFLCALAVVHSKMAPLLTDREPIPGQYIIMLKDGHNVDAFISSLELTIASHNINKRIRHKYSYGLALRFPDSKIDLLRELEGVKYIEQDGLVYAYLGSWGLDRIDQRGATLDDVYQYTSTGKNVNVYVIDTGINYSHVELEGRAKFFFDPLGGDGKDCNGHGSHCSGTVGAGYYGVAKNTNLWSCRTLTCNGSGSKSDSIAAVDKITTEGQLPGVVSMSLGGSKSQAQNDAVKNCHNAGFVVSVAAGNDNSDACNQSPASAPEAITVGSTDKDTDARSSFSNYGSCLDIFAPGRSITSIYHSSDYVITTLSGTSMACPHVSGAAAKLLQWNPTWTADKVTQEILGAATSEAVGNPGTGSPNLLLYSR